MSATPTLDAFRAALAASPDHAGWTDPLWALAYYEAQCIFDSYTTKDLARALRDPAGCDLRTYSDDESGELSLTDLVEGWDDETPCFESILAALR